MRPFELARIRPQTLFGLSVFCAIVGAILLSWLLVRLFERLVDRPRVPRPAITYWVFIMLTALMVVVGITAWGTNRLLVDHVRVAEPVRLGQLRCESLGNGRVRGTFVPEPGGGAAGGLAETVDEAGEACQLEADFVTMRRLPARIAGPWLARVRAVGQAMRPRKASAAWTPGAHRMPLSLLVRDVTRIDARAPATAPSEAPVHWGVMALPPAEGAAPAVLGLQRLGAAQP